MACLTRSLLLSLSVSLVICLAFAPLTASGAPTASAGQTPKKGAAALVTAMQQRYESMKSFSADFSQTLHHQESGASEEREGSLLFARPFLLRWESRSPEAEILVVNEREVWNYLPDEALASRYSPAVVEDSASVIRVVTGQSRLDEDFTIIPQKDEEGLAVLLLYPKNPGPQMVEARLWIDRRNHIIQRARILDFYGNSNEVRFRNIRPDASAPASSFAFTPPKGVTVQDLQDQAAPEHGLLR